MKKGRAPKIKTIQKARSFMDTPAWMQVVERRLERAAEDILYAARGREARSRPAQAGIQWF